MQEEVEFTESVSATPTTIWTNALGEIHTGEVATRKVTDVLNDQSQRWQIITLTEAEARRQYPDLVVASLGANRMDKPGGIIIARVLLDGMNGILVNHRTRTRDQERAPVAFDIKRIMREGPHRRKNVLVDGRRR